MSQEEKVSQEPPEEAQDLDSLLSEFDESSPEPEEKPKDESEVQQLKAQVERLEQNQVLVDARKGVDEAVTQIKEIGGLDNISDQIIEDMLQGWGSRDHRLAAAFSNRLQDPKGYQKILAGLAGEFKTALQQPDEKITEDQEALRATVRGQEDKTVTPEGPTPADLGKMTKREFEEFKAALT